MSSPRHYRNSNVNTVDCVTTCCFALFAACDESAARDAHDRGDHYTEARNLDNAAEYQHLAGNHHAEQYDREEARAARNTCVLL